MAKVRARARAVDMLGRQQIAGIQNALSELFKNAHDAYASRVAVDFFDNSDSDKESFVIIRDDGLGMTQDDFETKWLVLGTESKTAANRSTQYIPKDKPLRPVTGEKGIGRLAIALLGRQVIVLSRAIRNDGLHDLVLAFVHWGLFEIPGLNLEDIEIPVDVVPGGTLPSTKHITLVKQRLKDCITELAKTHDDSQFIEIIEEIDSFSPDPEALDKFFAARDPDGALSLTDSGTGTHFLIGPSNPIVKIEIDFEDRSEDYSFRKQLLGFCDQTFAKLPPATISTSFRRWRPGDLVGQDFLDADTFFNTSELADKSDHLLTGSVDEFGQFRGSLRVYEKLYDQVIIPWPESRGKKTKCGPFKVSFGYLMGRNAESIVPDAAYTAMNQKLEHLGGMYVYLDGIRVLPYGDHANDWLEVERRRTKGAGHYFFSYRRMFGAVTLTRDKNGDLHEKAGREGFQQNEAYRHLRDICQNLLIQLAAEFFRKSGTYTEAFEQVQTDLKKRAAALERQQKRASVKRKDLQTALLSFSGQVNAGEPQASVTSLRNSTLARLEEASALPDRDRAASALIRIEREAIGALNEFRKKYTLRKPAGIALTKDLTREWEGYVTDKSRMDSELFSPFEAEISSALSAISDRAHVQIDQRKRLDEMIRSHSGERLKELTSASREVIQAANVARQAAFNVADNARLALDKTIKSIEAELYSTDISVLKSEQIELVRRKWEDHLTEIELQHRNALLSTRDMLASLSESLSSSDPEEPAQALEAMEQRMLALEEQTEADFEMVQLGLAVAIINHEFSASIKRVRHSIRDLGQLSERTRALRPLYDSIRVNFDHLDGHLNLFTPLQRRLHRTVSKIDGTDIKTYTLDLFRNRFERHEITFECTESFLQCSVECFPSTLYPAIINLVDNAIFWLASQNSARTIRMDATSGTLIIANSGPLIEERDRERIFERGYSRKPGGRGLGLFISARALKAENMLLSVTSPPPGFGAAFMIAIPNLKMAP